MDSLPKLQVVQVHPVAELPRRMSPDAAGFDLAACLPDGPVVLGPGEWQAIPTGVAMAIPRGYEGQVRPRSGLARRHGLTVLNSPGTVDADYRGEVLVLLVNHGREPATVQHLDRVAQLVIAPVAMCEILPVDRLPDTSRGSGGFGSTGV